MDEAVTLAEKPHVGEEQLRLPNFFLVGANKAGTTSLHHYLNQHPDVFMSALKEPHYFDLCGRPAPLKETHPYRSLLVSSWHEYLRLFRTASTQAAIGEASTGYLTSPYAPHIIARTVPHARIVAVLRHPVDRAYSQFRMYRRDGLEPLASFADAFRAQQKRQASGWPETYQYSALSRYGEGLRRYFAMFPSSQIRVYRYERLQDDPAGLLRDLFEFLGVDPSVRADVSARLNESPPQQGPLRLLGRNPYSRRLRRRLAQTFAEDLKVVDSLTGERFSSWLAE